MVEGPKLVNPWLVSVWPGMGNIAVSAGYYLMAKLGMHQLAEFSPRELFDIEYVDIKDGIIHPGRLPRSRFFVWKDPKKRHDIVVFIGEAQPPVGKYAFCHRLIEFARHLGVERVYTFAAMATHMHPAKDARIFAASTDEEGLEELRKYDPVLLQDGRISGLNGALLGVAAEDGLQGFCLMGEVPLIFSQMPFPIGSHVVLETFCRMAGISLDLNELKQQGDEIADKLSGLLSNVEQTVRQQTGKESFGLAPEPENEDKEQEGIDAGQRQRLEHLFNEARKDRSKAYELKAELDRLHVFDQYEDRFLDLFRSR